jgi:hypothetical protein
LKKANEKANNFRGLGRTMPKNFTRARPPILVPKNGKDTFSVSLTIPSIFTEGHVPKGYSSGNLFTRLLSNCTSEGQINSGTLLGPPMLKPSFHDLVMSIQQLGGSRVRLRALWSNLNFSHFESLPRNEAS